jgi:hypothetical protein
MQGIPSNTASVHSVARFRRGFLAIGSIAAIAGASLMAAAPVAAVAGFSIVVAVNSDLNPADHKEGVNSLFAPIATFTDDNACTAPGVCNHGNNYNVNVRWGDNNTDNVPADEPFISQLGNQATYGVTIHHGYADENNCPPPAPPCGFNVQILVTNKLNLLTSDPTLGTGQIAVKDQPLVSGNGITFSANEQTPFTKVIGSFQDANKLSVAGSLSDTPEYHVVINWGDSPVNDHTGTVTVVTSTPCPTTCTVDVSGSHTYAKFDQYTVSVTITDGSSPIGTGFESTANVFETRFPVNQSGAGTPGSRVTNQSPPGTSGPRIAHVGLGVQRSVATSNSSSTSAARAQAIDLNWFDAMVQVFQGPAALQQLVR